MEATQVKTDFQLGLGPTAVVYAPLDSVLNDEAPAGLFRSPGMALEPDHQLFKLLSREHSGLSGHGHGFRTPLRVTLR